MRQVSNDSPSRAKQHILRHLDAGATGCLFARLPNDVLVSIYLMLGEVLAAHSSDDRERLLRRLTNAGSIQGERLDALRNNVAQGHSITDELYDLVGDDVMQDLLHERFRENLFAFLQVQGTASFEPMESVMVENIQVGHDSRAVIEEIDALVVATARLREPPSLVLAPGAGTMKNPDHLRLASICHPRLPLHDLLQRSPWESGRTLGMVAEMLERGALIAVSAQKDPREITDRPSARSEPRAAKLIIPSGKPNAESGRLPTDPTRSTGDASARDTVAAALASAVAGAVAKVGRQRIESGSNSAGAGTGISPASGPIASSASPTSTPASSPASERPAARSPADPVSAPLSRPAVPVKMVINAPSKQPSLPAADMVRTTPPERLAAVPSVPTKPVVTPPVAPVATSAASQPATPPVPAPAAAAPPPKPKPLPFHDDQPTEEIDAEMAMFQDYDHAREGGDFLSSQQLLDRVEVIDVLDGVETPKKPAAAPPETAKQEIFIEMEDAENATHAELAGAVSLNFAGPKLAEDEAQRKLEVINDVFATMVASLDAARGVGMGQSRVQLLIEGTPGSYASLFKGVEVDAHGRLPVEVVLRNLRKRPASEHRRLLNRGLSDVIERALSLASEELDERGLESMLEKIAGYQQRLGM